MIPSQWPTGIFEGAMILWAQLEHSCLWLPFGLWLKDKMQHEIFKHSKAHLPCNPLIFVAASLLLIQNGKRKRQQRGNAGEKNHKSILLLFFQQHLWAIVTITIKLYLTGCQHEFSKKPKCKQTLQVLPHLPTSNYLLCLGLALLSAQLYSPVMCLLMKPWGLKLHINLVTLQFWSQ